MSNDPSKTSAKPPAPEKPKSYFVLKACKAGKPGRVIQLTPTQAKEFGDKIRPAKAKERALAGHR